MSIIDELADYLQTQGLGEKAKTIFANGFPVEVKEGLMIKNSLSGIPIDPELPGLYHAPIQIVVRSPTHSVGESLADQVQAALSIEQPIDLTSFQIRSMRSRHLPISFPISKGSIFEFSLNFNLIFATKA